MTTCQTYFNKIMGGLKVFTDSLICAQCIFSILLSCWYKIGDESDSNIFIKNMLLIQLDSLLIFLMTIFMKFFVKNNFKLKYLRNAVFTLFIFVVISVKLPLLYILNFFTLFSFLIHFYSALESEISFDK